jgi:hypothetical protein
MKLQIKIGQRMDSRLNNIPAFWLWFSEHKVMLGATDVSQELISEFEEKLFVIDQLGWEIGPGLHVAHRLSLSPYGNFEKLNLTRKIIQMAPSFEDWEFHVAMPPKDWNLSFNLMIANSPFVVDGKLWEFVAYKFKDGTYDLIYKPDSLSKQLGDKYLQLAATIITDGELGEEQRIEAIPKIEVVLEWSEDMRKFARKLEPGLLRKSLNLPLKHEHK